MPQDEPVEVLERKTAPWPYWLEEGRSAVFQSFVPAVEIAGSAPRLSYAEDEMPRDADPQGIVAADLAAAVAGTRIRVAGSEAFVSRMLAILRAEGAIDEEIEAVVAEAPPDGPSRIRFFCIVCTTTSVADAGFGDVVRCDGCRTELTISHQFSSHRGAFGTWPTGRGHG